MRLDFDHPMNSDHNDLPGTRIELDADEITFGGDPAPRSTSVTGRRLRWLAEKGALVVATAAILLAVQVTGGGESSRTSPAAPASPPGSDKEPSVSPIPPVPLRLVVPETAVPGERLTVLAYRNRRLCGAAELRFDGVPAAHELVRYAGTTDGDHVEVFMAMEVPRATEPGRHKIQLYGPRRGGSGAVCGDFSEHQAHLATAAISVESPRG
jgi:hypothetical protein